MARALLREFDVLMETITDRVWQRVPAYSAQHMDRVELADRIRDNVRNVLVCLLEGRGPHPDEMLRTALAGERRALQGIEDIAILQSFRTAERVLSDEYQSWCARMQVRDANARTGRIRMVAALDTLEKGMLEAYWAMERQIEGEHLLTEPTLFRRLAEGSRIHSNEVEELARVLGLADAEQSPFITVAVTPVEAEDSVSLELLRHRLLSALTASIGAPALSGIVPENPLDGPDARMAVLLALPWDRSSSELIPVVEDALAETGLNRSARAVVGESRLGLSQLSVPAQQALTTLSTTRNDAEASGVVRYVDRLVEVFVKGDPNFSRALRTRYLAPLLGTELEDTLRAHLATDLSLMETAKRLHVHKNTVVYRLRRISELTGLDLHRPRDITRAVLALDAADSACAD